MEEAKDKMRPGVSTREADNFQHLLEGLDGHVSRLTYARDFLRSFDSPKGGDRAGDVFDLQRQG